MIPKTNAIVAAYESHLKMRLAEGNLVERVAKRMAKEEGKSLEDVFFGGGRLLTGERIRGQSIDTIVLDEICSGRGWTIFLPDAPGSNSEKNWR